MKTCTRCYQEKPYKDFYKRKGYKDGYHSWCKSCKYTYDRQWLKSKDDHQEKARIATKRWYAEKGREYHFNWRNENREKSREYQRRYAELNREKRRESYRKRRFKIENHETDITSEWLQELRSITTNCELCGVELTDGHQHDYSFGDLDHILPVNVGGKHIQGNVRYICHLCNLQRPKDGSDILQNNDQPTDNQ